MFKRILNIMTVWFLYWCFLAPVRKIGYEAPQALRNAAS